MDQHDGYEFPVIFGLLKQSGVQWVALANVLP